MIYLLAAALSGGFVLVRTIGIARRRAEAIAAAKAAHPSAFDAARQAARQAAQSPRTYRVGDSWGEDA